MENRELQARVQRELELCRRQTEEAKEDAYLSTVRAEEERTLRRLADRLAAGETPAAMLAWLKERIPLLRQQMEQELDRPTFDWYDEHYHYKLADGEREACRRMAALLEQQEME